MQAGLAVLGSISGLIAGLSGSGLAWLLGAVLLFSVVPFTLIRIKPLNDQLLDPSRDLEAPDTLALLQQWGRLHWARSASGGVAFLLFLLG